ncbi:Pectin lyase-like superfamily protein [Quillaja saponaria]|uniref:Pectin lyase-like superfamily protein n=1 Tax=Quillaja saponaria TaxID=32244 RepID=A0AAD7LEW7_QUISA|nr:Pectin lyase-like superfamily protein [Quillaja saponaria]
MVLLVMAFLKAWNAACNTTASETSIIIIPSKQTFLVNPIAFRGPCKATNITFLIQGRLVAPNSPKVWKGLDPSQWLAFRGVCGLNIAGNGKIDGKGSGWWNQSCRDHPGLALNILSCNESILRNLHFTNSPQTHILVIGSYGINIKNVRIEAPETSPNTDGIHIHASRNVMISDSIIGTGDDCVSIGDYTSKVYISSIKCGPGHGISIGSLGRGGNFVKVENIHVSKVYFKGTTNGVRIKTWQVGKGYIQGITFEDMYFNSVQNPIIIDQNYCNVRDACKEQKTGVHVTDVVYNNMSGTSITALAINLNCSQSVACTGILMKSIELRSAQTGHKVISSCRNAHGFAFGVVQPDSCLEI